MIPRQKLEEFVLEVELSSRKFLVVEGSSDSRFFKAWAAQVGIDDRMVVRRIDEVEIELSDSRFAHLSDGNRSRVMALAVCAFDSSDVEPSDMSFRCVADRDSGHHVDEAWSPWLLWTDFPALESYAVEAKVLDHANLMSFSEVLPAGREVLLELDFALRELFAVRQNNENLAKPNYSAGLKKGSNLFEFSVDSTVAYPLRGECRTYVRPTGTDTRQIAYGHDIGELLLARFANELKNRAGVKSLEALEMALMNAVLAVRAFEGEKLFQDIIVWLSE